MRMIVTGTLRQAGYGDQGFVEAVDGADGLAEVASESPDLVLSDWNMPELTGIEFLRVLRAAGNEVRFGFVRSKSTDAMRARAEAAGALFLIGKPFTADMSPSSCPARPHRRRGAVAVVRRPRDR